MNLDYLRESILEYTRIKPRLENLGPVFILTLRWTAMAPGLC